MILLGILLCHKVEAQEFLVKTDTSHHKFDKTAEYKKKKFLKVHPVHISANQKQGWLVMSDEFALSITLRPKGSKKGRILEDLTYGQDMHRHSEVYVIPTIETPGDYELVVSTVNEATIGNYTIVAMESNDKLAQVTEKTDDCVKLKALLEHRKIDYGLLRDKLAWSGRRDDKFRFDSSFEWERHHVAHIMQDKGKVSCYITLVRTDNLSIANQFYTDHREEVKACFELYDKVKEKPTTGKQPTSRLLETENGLLRLELKKNPDKQGYYLVVLEIR